MTIFGGRLKESSEQASPTMAQDGNVTQNVNNWQRGAVFTLGRKGKLYIVTGLELTQNNTLTNNIVLGLFKADADPPVDTRPMLKAYSAEVAATSGLLKATQIISEVLRGGEKYFAAYNSNVNRNIGFTTVGNQNSSFSETYTVNPLTNRTIVWSAATFLGRLRAYWREYK